MRKSSKVTALGRIALFVSFAFAGAAVIPHLELKSSNPQDGTSLSKWPVTIELTFTGSVEAQMSRAVLTSGGSDHRLVAAPSPDRTTLAFAVPRDLPGGVAELHWVTTGPDGHPVNGILRFEVGAEN